MDFKAKRKRKFLACFRPVVEASLVKQRRRSKISDRPVFTYVAVGEKEGVVFPRILGEASSSDRDRDEAVRRERICCGCGFPRILKAALIKMSLAKKTRKRKNGQKPKSTTEYDNPMSKNKNPNRQQSLSKTEDRTKFISNNSHLSSSRTSATFISTPLCSSCSSFHASNSRTSSDLKNNSFRLNPVGPRLRQDNNQLHQHVGRLYGFSNGWCLLLLVCLSGLVLLGRFCAIFCTLIWLLLVPCRRVRFVSVPPKVEIGSEGYNKRVIMEGLLARDRSASRSPWVV